MHQAPARHLIALINHGLKRWKGAETLRRLRCAVLKAVQESWWTSGSAALVKAGWERGGAAKEIARRWWCGFGKGGDKDGESSVLSQLLCTGRARQQLSEPLHPRRYCHQSGTDPTLQRVAISWWLPSFPLIS